jgi:CheY-like chemotaxis protein
LARKILLADDSVTAQNMGRKILADAGYEVITVNNGSAALKKINEQRPDLIVLDVYMPGYSGLEVCQRLKDAGETSRIPILLTVGKLEPFKPEEARRARADGFIVKPFEASELLSALSKLEDKVVPRGETSKTGRFARATAPVEDNRFDKSMSAEHDSGWKTRIVFPKKHKEEAVEPEGDDPSIYNPVNKDLRTVVESKPIEQTPAARAQEAAPAPVKPAPEPVPAKQEHVDLRALAPAGLPKDVTPEEIAAIAAAAAQMKGSLTEVTPESPAEMAVVAPVEPEALKAETPVAEPVTAPASAVTAPAVPAATFAEQAARETNSDIEEKEREKDREPEVAASVAVAGPVAAPSEPANPASESWSPAAPAKSDEPVTIAAAAAANSAAPPRWTAVAVALAPEDAGVSLEQEMQRMYSAYAAAEADKTAIFRLPDLPMPKAEIAAAPPAVPAPVALTPEPAVSAPAEVVPEAAATMKAVASAATDAITAAVAELESVAAAYVAEKSAGAPFEEPVKSEVPVPVPVVSESTKTKSESVEAKQEPVPDQETAAQEAALPASEATAQETPAQEAKAEEIKEPVPAVEAEAAKPEAAQSLTEETAKKEAKEEPASPEAKPEESKDVAPVVEAPLAETPTVEAVVEDRTEPATASELSQAPAAPARVGFRARGMDDMAKRESDTAAAWASWRKIRETGSKPAAESSSMENEELSEPKDAAMAVAAGAEHSPEDAESLDSDPEIASIVDSVLADMRPKIVEEIARKLGKKK